MTKYITCIFAFFLIQTASAQFSEAEQKILYPEKYTFEAADVFKDKKEYQKATWLYINLFPNNRAKVIERMKEIKKELDTTDMRMFIVNAFSLYATFDPTITTFKNDVPDMNMEMLQKKGSWGDQLIAILTDTSEPLKTAEEYNTRGKEKAQKEDLQGAILDFDRAIEIDGQAKYYYNRAYANSLLQHNREAIEDYDRVIKMKYMLADAYFERGFNKDQLKDLDGAIADYTQSIKQNKKSPTAYNNRASAFYRKKEFTKAVKDMDKAIQLKPDYAGAYYNRGAIKKEMGDQIGACKDWLQAKELGMPEAAQILQQLCD